MRIEENTRAQIETRMASMGDYVKMEYLSGCLKKTLDFDTKRFCLLKLSSLYDSRGMLMEAGRLMRNAGDINPTMTGKIQDFLKSAEMFIKAGNLEEADISMKRALVDASELQRKDIKLKVKTMYFAAVKSYATPNKRKHAVKIYEKLLTLDLTPTERKQVLQQLTPIYENLGKIREYYSTKRMLDIPEPPKAEKPAPSKYDIELGEDLSKMLSK